MTTNGRATVRDPRPMGDRSLEGGLPVAYHKIASASDLIGGAAPRCATSPRATQPGIAKPGAVSQSERVKRSLMLWILGLAVGLSWGCGPQSGPAAPAVAAPRETQAAAGEPTRAQPRLPTEDLFLGRHRLKTEIARTTDQIRAGMMFRESIGEDEAMLFVFYRAHRASFWMKNVTVELSVAYLDAEGRILEIHELVPGEEKPVEASSAQVQYALETSRGWFERHDVGPGALVRTAKGSLGETFLGR